MIEFLSDAWISAAHAAVRDLVAPISGVRSITFEHKDDDRGEVIHSQMWQDGRLIEWQVGRRGPVDATIVLPLWATYLWMFGRAVEGATLQLRDQSGLLWSVPPTALELSRTASSTVFAGATVTAEVRIPDHPFGEQVVAYEFIDGVVQPNGPTSCEAEPGVRLVVPFQASTSFLLGAIPYWELARASSLDGDVLLFGCLAGLLSPPGGDRRWAGTYAAIESGTDVLSAMGLIRGVLSGLKARTNLPLGLTNRDA